MADELLIERRDDVLWITIHRPDRRNSFDGTTVGALLDAASSIPPGVRAVALTGAGTSFCAGADLDWMAPAELDERAAQEGAERISRMFAALDALPVPLVARVNGPAAGGGVALAAIADAAIADAAATFQMSEVLIGLVPAMAMPYLARRIGPGRAREWALTARRIDAACAAEWGLVGEVAAAGKLDEAVEARLALLRRAEPGALSAMKAFLRRTEGRAPSEAAADAIAVIAERRRSPEARERVAAFRAKGRKG